MLDCISGDVIGLRPRHVLTVDVRQLRAGGDDEADRHRAHMFDDIFRKRVWGRESGVDFSASGTLYTSPESSVGRRTHRLIKYSV